jgi:hypothetical protein
MESIRNISLVVSAVLFIIFMAGMLFMSRPYKEYQEKQFIYQTMGSVKYQSQIIDMQSKMDTEMGKMIPMGRILLASIVLLVIGIVITIVLWICWTIIECKFKGKYKQ